MDKPVLSITPKAPAATPPSYQSMQTPPDFDAYVQAKMERATTALSKPIEFIFTLAVIVSFTLTPFIMLQALCPALMVKLISTGWVFAFVPYVIFMTILGLKVASLFGCTAWDRIANVWRD